jgi:hypothetical protein
MTTSAARGFRRKFGILMGLIACISIADLLTGNVNLSILYPLAVLLSTRIGRRKLLWAVAFACVFLAYAGYMLGPPFDPLAAGWHQRLGNYRMLNRTLAAASILATGLIMHLWMALRVRLSSVQPDPKDANYPVMDEVLRAFEQLCAAIICLLLAASVMVADICTPAQFNLPILYVIPIASCAWLRSRMVLWVMLPIVLIATWVGFALSDTETLRAVLSAPLARNRILASCAAIGAALVVDAWLRHDHPGSLRRDADRGGQGI